jgi:hypothetical protein
MKKLFFVLLLLIFITGCKNSKSDLAGNEKINADDFLKAFPEINLPVIIPDTALRNFGDTIIISKTVFTQFVQDTALEKFTDNSAGNYIIHPAGIIHKKDRDFLLATFSSVRKTALGVFVLDDKHKFLASFLLLNTLQKDEYNHSVSITEEPTFIIKKEKTAPNSLNLYSRNGFAYNAASNAFAEVLHDSNEDTARNNEIINPIDTLPSTNKFSGDYIADKRNYISVRDGKNALTYTFFIHFEKDNGNCVGELKGMMSLTNEKSAVFTESGEPCVIDFKFTGNTIKIKEQDNCGNHRGITCPFDFSFKKKILPKKKSK